MTPRTEALLTAFSKTQGRCFEFSGKLVLTEEERDLLKAAEHLDFVEAFRAHVEGVIQERRIQAQESPPPR